MEKATRPEAARVNAAAAATFLIFGLGGLVFASWAARIPAAAALLGIGNAQTGTLILFLAVGSLIALPLTGAVVNRIGTAHTVRIGGCGTAAASAVLALGLQQSSVPLCAAALFVFGLGVGLWDVAQNIEGADVEHRLRRTIMPQFHAAYSGGAFLGALVGAGLSALDVGLPQHLLAVAVLTGATALVVPRRFLPHQRSPHTAGAKTPGGGFARWREPRTVLIGLMVLGAALAEGAANDWVAKATVDGLGTTEATGALVFALFVGSMTLFRFFGGRFIDRYGRVPVLRASFLAAFVGLLMFVLGPSTLLAAAGAVLWGAGAALGFPVGMSAAADDRQHAAARVSVVATLGYVSFLAGPPLLGLLGEYVGIRNALLAVSVTALLSLLLVGAAASPAAPAPRTSTAGQRGDQQ